MNNVDAKRATILITICALLALSITTGWNSLRQPPQNPAYTVVRTPANTVMDNSAHAVADKTAPGTENAVRRASDDRAVQHAAYLARYLNSGFSRKLGMKMVAVAIASEDGRFNSALNSAITDHLKGGSVNIITSLFRPAFVTDGLFANILASTYDVLDNLELSKSIDVLVLGQQTVEYSSDPSLENVVTANMRFELTAISIGTGQNQSWAYNANGAGFKQTEARSLAEERLAKQIARDTTLSLKF